MILNIGTRFWLVVAVIQVVFGLSVFAITRQTYIANIDDDTQQPLRAEQPLPGWTDRVLDLDAAIYDVPSNASTFSQDPTKLSAQADSYFANQQYTLAAKGYERLLAFDPSNASVLNNLGLTLHYLGRSEEALERLHVGSRLDPMHQRLWLTLGFVNREVGNIAEARSALTMASDIDPGTAVGKSAARMIDQLP